MSANETSDDATDKNKAESDVDHRDEGTTSFFQLWRERRTRNALYHAKSYWDARAEARSGLARSLWPSNKYNALWDERQRDVLMRALGNIRGDRVVDIGCGTGRMSRFFAEQGAREVVGVDFSPGTVDAARAETQGHSEYEGVSFTQGDVLVGLDHVGRGSFDIAVALACLSMACRDLPSLERAMMNVARLVRHGGRVVLLEPIHRSPLLRRSLSLGIEEWVGVANRAGLDLLLADRMGFVPIRLFCSVRDLPESIVGPLFRVGEELLDAAPYFAPLSDYKLLVFRT